MWSFSGEAWFGLAVPSNSPEQLAVNVAREALVDPILGMGSPVPL